MLFTESSQMGRPVFGTLDVDRTRYYRGPIRFEVFGKELCFGLKVVLHALVIIKMVMGEIGKGSNIIDKLTYSFLGKRMGRNFHHNMGDAVLFHHKQQMLKFFGGRSCMRSWQDYFLSIGGEPVIDRTNDTDAVT